MSTSQVKTKFAPSSTVYTPLLEGGSKMILGGAGLEGRKESIVLCKSCYNVDELLEREWVLLN